MKKLLFVVFAALASSAFATNYYVDAVSGNDSWDGTRPIESANGLWGPRRTLVAAMALAQVGDTVYAAEGTYDQGGEKYDTLSCSNRVVILPGRRLVASGRRELTVIKGQGAGANKNANGTDAIRCVFLVGKTADAPGGVIKGFTITGGYTMTGAVGADTCGGGVGGPLIGSDFDKNGLVVDCDIYDNAAGQYGPNVVSSTLLRCRVGNAVSGDYEFFRNTLAIDSFYFGNKKLYWHVKLINCTHTGSLEAYGNTSKNFWSYNCLFTNPSYNIHNLSQFFCTYFRVAQKTGPSYDGNCRFELTGEDLKMSKLDPARPLPGSVVAEQGNLTYYYAATNGWTDANAAWQKEFDLTDLNGNPRVVNNKIDVGCCQSAASDVYVNAASGNDMNNGASASTAVKTLARAMALSHRGDTIYAAEGDYDVGGDIVVGTCSNRVTVLPGRRLVASGKQAETRIFGAVAATANGCATNAMRCVYLMGTVCGLPGGIVKGFTLKNGRTWPGSVNSSTTVGGGVTGEGLAADCAFEGCGSAFRGPNAAKGVTLFRCRIGKSSCGDFDCFDSCKLIGCLYLNTQRIYYQPSLVNCTIAENVTPYSNGGSWPCHNCLFFGTSGVGERMAYKSVISCAVWPSPDPTGATRDAECLFGATLSEVRASAGGRPWKGSLAIDGGDLSLYLAATNGWHDAWQAEFSLADLGGVPRTNGKISVGCFEYAEMFVNAETGNDANDGLTQMTAKKSIAGAISSGCEPMTVKVSAGIYDEVEMAAPDGELTRVVVPNGWAIEGAGRGETVILGKLAATADGVGEGAVRCAYVDTEGYLCGVTLRNGRTSATGRAGGVWLKGALVASEIDGCRCGTGDGSDQRGCAARGDGGVLIRCYIHDNAGGNDVYQGDMVGCVYDKSYYGSGLLLNNNIGGSAAVMNWPKNPTNPIYNSVMGASPGRGMMCYNCMICAPFTYWTTTHASDSSVPEGVAYTNNGYEASTCVVGVSKPTLDADFRPVKDSNLVDAGSRALYDAHFPTKWVMFKDKDVSDGPRVLNGGIDIGAGEYDWRVDFSRVLAKKDAVVVDVGPDVTLSGERELSFVDGNAIRAIWTASSARRITFTAEVPEGGSLTVTVGGIVQQPVGGVYGFDVAQGANDVMICYAGVGTARISGFPQKGFVLTIH